METEPIYNANSRTKFTSKSPQKLVNPIVKIVYSCYGSFGISQRALDLAKSLAPDDIQWIKANMHLFYIERHNPILVRVVEELGEEANTKYAKLEIYEVERGSKYRIEVNDYDGHETVMFPDDYNWTIAI